MVLPARIGLRDNIKGTRTLRKMLHELEIQAVLSFSVCLCLSLSLYVSLCDSVCLFLSLPVCLSIYLSVCVFVCMSSPLFQYFLLFSIHSRSFYYTFPQ